MKSTCTPRFWELHDGLPRHVQALAAKTYRLWREDPTHSSLRFKKLRGGAGDRVSIRIGAHHRAIGGMRGETVQLVWIGTHEQYNKLA